MRNGELETGDFAPDFTLPAVEGEPVTLSDTLRRRHNVLLVFLRHLGCLICREHVAQLCRHQDEFQRLNSEVIVISFGTATLARRWIEETCSPFAMLLDEERKVYGSYGLKRSWLRSWNLKTGWFYIRLLLSGQRWRGIQGDPNQLGGDFIVDSEGIVRLAHPSQDATDRPKIADLITVFRQLQQTKVREESRENVMTS